MLRLAKLCTALFLAVTLISCGSDPASTTAANPAAALNSALSYLSTSLPTIGSRRVEKRAANRAAYDLVTNWATDDIMDPVGGYPPGSDGMDMTIKVSPQTFFTNALNPDFEVPAGDEEHDSYRPTIFGRFESRLKILGYIAAATGAPPVVNGLYAEGTYSVDVDVEGQSITGIQIVVTNTPTSAHYDQKFTITKSPMIDEVFYVRNNATNINFLAYEIGEHKSVTICAWDLATGNMRFEYLSDDDANEDNIEHFRFFVESTGGASYLMGLYGDTNAGTADQQQAFGVKVDSGKSSTTGTLSTNSLMPNADTLKGVGCVTFATGAITTGACSGQTNVIDMSTTLPTALTNLRAVTAWSQHVTRRTFDETSTVVFTSAAEFLTEY